MCHQGVPSCLSPPPGTGHLTQAVPKPRPCPLRSPVLTTSSHQRLLVKTRLILIVTGHLTFLARAPIHGIVLRFVAGPQDVLSAVLGLQHHLGCLRAIFLNSSTLRMPEGQSLRKPLYQPCSSRSENSVFSRRSCSISGRSLLLCLPMAGPAAAGSRPSSRGSLRTMGERREEPEPPGSPRTPGRRRPAMRPPPSPLSPLCRRGRGWGRPSARQRQPPLICIIAPYSSFA
uniref:Uncharacterized protein n=1 Tax=Dromaius novaehollandiae TaxID=8790 RepID=A0A8C4P8A8_DRONO